VFEGVADELLLAVQVQLPEDVADVVLHCLLGDVELVGDLPVAVAPRHELQHLTLAFGEGRGRSRRLGQLTELSEYEGDELG
jgi:hypothetical protein